MRQIRPFKIFTLLDAPAPERLAQVMLPQRRGIGGTSLLETMLIIAALRIVNARRVFEFGTFLGSNTLNMALNLPEDAKLFTLDLDAEHAAGAEQLPEDASLTQTHLASQLDFAGTAAASKITTLFGDSTTFDFSPWKGAIDCSFIDGGHDYATVKSDSENALNMAATGRPSCILWHDYHNWEYPALTSYMDELAKTQELFHVGDTMLCGWLNDPDGTILPRLA